MNKRIFWTISDQKNLEYFAKMQISFKKFHPKDELRLFDDLAIQATRDPLIFYRATPYFTKQLMEEGYDEVCKLDCDQLITGSLDHIWEEDFDVACVQNSNPREVKNYLVSVWDINPLDYINCGFVVMKNKGFVDHWWNLCSSYHFNSYQMREQDLLNIMVFYDNYKVKFLDKSNKWHGLVWKKYEPEVQLRDGKLILPKNNEWPKDEDKELVCWHVAGGNTPNKMNYRTKFQPEVVKFLDKLTS